MRMRLWRRQSIATARTSSSTGIERARRLRGASESKHGQVVVAVELGDGEDCLERDGRGPCASSGVDLAGRPLVEPLMRPVLVEADGVGLEAARAPQRS